MGGQTRSYLAKTLFPLFCRVFRLRRQKTWSLARMKTGIFLRFRMSPNNSKNQGLGIVSPGASRQSTEKCQIGPTLLIYGGGLRETGTIWQIGVLTEGGGVLQRVLRKIVPPLQGALLRVPWLWGVKRKSALEHSPRHPQFP